MERKSVPCPCCKNTLYTIGVLSEREGVYLDGLKIETENSVSFMVCRHCASRIRFTSSEDDQGKIAYRVADVQQCQGGQ